MKVLVILALLAIYVRSETSPDFSSSLTRIKTFDQSFSGDVRLNVIINPIVNSGDYRTVNMNLVIMYGLICATDNLGDPNQNLISMSKAYKQNFRSLTESFLISGNLDKICLYVSNHDCYYLYSPNNGYPYQQCTQQFITSGRIDFTAYIDSYIYRKFDYKESILNAWNPILVGNVVYSENGIVLNGFATHQTNHKLKLLLYVGLDCGFNTTYPSTLETSNILTSDYILNDVNGNVNIKVPHIEYSYYCFYLKPVDYTPTYTPVRYSFNLTAVSKPKEIIDSKDYSIEIQSLKNEVVVLQSQTLDIKQDLEQTQRSIPEFSSDNKTVVIRVEYNDSDLKQTIDLFGINDTILTNRLQTLESTLNLLFLNDSTLLSQIQKIKQINVSETVINQIVESSEKATETSENTKILVYVTLVICIINFILLLSFACLLVRTSISRPLNSVGEK